MNTLTLGIDIGSTTAKAVLLEGDTILFQTYERHFSQVRSKTLEILEEMKPLLLGRTMTVAISGSAGLGMAEAAGVPFVQEVYATGEVVRRLAPDTALLCLLFFCCLLYKMHGKNYNKKARHCNGGHSHPWKTQDGTKRQMTPPAGNGPAAVNIEESPSGTPERITGRNFLPARRKLPLTVRRLAATGRKTVRPRGQPPGRDMTGAADIPPPPDMAQAGARRPRGQPPGRDMIGAPDIPTPPPAIRGEERLPMGRG